MLENIEANISMWGSSKASVYSYDLLQVFESRPSKNSPECITRLSPDCGLDYQNSKVFTEQVKVFETSPVWQPVWRKPQNRQWPSLDACRWMLVFEKMLCLPQSRLDANSTGSREHSKQLDSIHSKPPIHLHFKIIDLVSLTSLSLPQGRAYAEKKRDSPSLLISKDPVRSCHLQWMLVLPASSTVTLSPMA